MNPVLQQKARRIRLPGKWLLMLCVGLLGCAVGRQCGAQVSRDIVADLLHPGIDPGVFRSEVERRVWGKLDQLLRALELDPAQVSKLQLALQGDVSRFFRDLDAVREQTTHLHVRLPTDRQRARNEIVPLQHRLQGGIVDGDSLLNKMLEIELTEPQRHRYAAYLHDRHAEQVQFAVSTLAAELQSISPVTEQQRQQLIEFLEGQATTVQTAFTSDAHGGWAMLAGLSAADASHLLNAVQREYFLLQQHEYRRQLENIVR